MSYDNDMKRRLLYGLVRDLADDESHRVVITKETKHNPQLPIQTIGGQTHSVSQMQYAEIDVLLMNVSEEEDWELDETALKRVLAVESL